MDTHSALTFDFQQISNHFGRRKVKRKATPWTKIPVPDDEDDEEARWPDLVILGFERCIPGSRMWSGRGTPGRTSGCRLPRLSSRAESCCRKLQWCQLQDMKTASDALMELTTARMPKV